MPLHLGCGGFNSTLPPRRPFPPNSGSMCVTTAVEGRLTLRGDRTKDLNHLLTAEVGGLFFAGQAHRG